MRPRSRSTAAAPAASPRSSATTRCRRSAIDYRRAWPLARWWSTPSLPFTKPTEGPFRGFMSTAIDTFTNQYRRAHGRAKLEIEVTLESDHNFFLGLTENISEGGLFIATHSLRKVGTIVDLELQLPNLRDKFHAQGIVRWMRVYNEQSDTPPGLGIQFLNLPPHAAHAIREFVNSRDAIFWEE